ncbi:hypothetical protein [Azorhizobium sp. AG788]|uniref:hypothetical protein n=1 Tax=Azorhizobium sp. AG788 TaxID=2183897 RepID=UPI00313928B3
MTIAAWPAVLKPRNCSPPELRNAARGGGQSFTGVEQRVFSDAGRWEITYEVPVSTRAQQLAWRAMVARLRAGEDILLTIFDKFRPAGVPQGSWGAGVSSDAALRATTLHLVTANVKVEAGVHFSIGPRLYRVMDVVSQTAATSISDWFTTGAPWSDAGIWVDDAGSGLAAYEVKILPPLRAAAPSGTTANFRDLVCLCTLADMSSGDLSLDLGKFGTPSITFAEA